MKRAATVLLSGMLVTLGSIGGACSQERPNVLIILTDDQRTEDMSYMPFLMSKKREARYFRHYFHTQAQCTPSRATMFTGMHPHNSKIENNKLPDGGYERFNQERLPLKTWGRILSQRAGYRTGMFGKYMNGYEDTTDIPAGWSGWFGLFKQDTLNDYRANDNGTIRFFGSGDTNYQTNVIADRTDAFMRKQINQRRPFAALFSTTCPHIPSTPALKYKGRLRTADFKAVSSKPNYNEPDMSDKPVIKFPSLTLEQHWQLEEDWRKRLECQLSVDDAIKRFWSTLSTTGALANTYIFFTTDNGWLHGEHRIPKSKSVPYVEAIESRLFVWGPGVVPGNETRFAANIDLMPTILELGGINTSDFRWIDGRSLVPLLKNDLVPWRQSLYLRGQPVAGDVPMWGSIIGRNADGVAGNVPMWGSIIGRNADGVYLYTEWSDSLGSEREYYNLNTDPYQLENAYPLVPSERIAPLGSRLDELRVCAGQSCRDAENLMAP